MLSPDGHATDERKRPKQTQIYHLVEQCYPTLTERLDAQVKSPPFFACYEIDSNETTVMPNIMVSLLMLLMVGCIGSVSALPVTGANTVIADGRQWAQVDLFSNLRS